MPRNSGRALVVNYSDLANDPRVLRQVEWLSRSGWTVDTLGFGEVPPLVSTAYRLRPISGPASSAPGRALVHLLLPPERRFAKLDGASIPADELPAGAYDAIVVNDIELLPWAERDAPALLSRGGVLHLDLNEYHVWRARSPLERLFRRPLSRYHRWLVSFVGSPVFSSRTTVARGIAELYARDWGIPAPALVRNAPPPERLEASSPSARIALVYHGNPERDRGLELIVDAMRLVEDRFTLTLMLTGTDHDTQYLRDAARGRSNVSFVPPVPVAQVPSRINAFDLEVIFFPPVIENLRFVLPNKFFEAIQARLGVVIGPSTEMVPLVAEYGVGVIAGGWTSADLAAAINSVQPEDVRRFKARADRAALTLNSEVEGERFLAALGAGTAEQEAT